MDGFIRFLLVAAVIVFFVVRKLRRVFNRMVDDLDTIDPDPTKPLPEAWTVDMMDMIEPEPANPTRHTARKPNKSPHTTYKPVTTTTTAAAAPQTTVADTTPAVDATDIEEIRRGVIWSEILTRKY